LFNAIVSSPFKNDQYSLIGKVEDTTRLSFINIVGYISGAYISLLPDE